MSLQYTLPIIVSCFVIVIICFVTAYYLIKEFKKLKAEENYKKEKKTSFFLLPNKMMQQHRANAAYLCQAETMVSETPAGVFCYLLALNEALLIIADTQPKAIYRLAYEKIVKFQVGEEKTLEHKKNLCLIPVEEEKSRNHILIAYQSGDGLKQLQFVSNLTNEDRWFNEAALKQNNIFAYVNARIPKQDTTITL